MANNTRLNAGSGGDQIATEDIGGVKYELVKLVDSTAGSVTRVGTLTDPIRFDPTGTTAQPISGTITSITDPVAVTGTFWQATQPISGSVSVSGTVAVSGTFWQATQPVSIASAVAVTGTFWQATQPVSAASLPLPSGASTSAAQTTGNTSLSSIDGKITACNTGAVVISSALPTGSNAIGKLAANSGVDIGDVDVTSISAGTNRIGAVYQVCGQMVDETGTVRTVNRSFVNATLSGNTELVATQGPGVRIRVLSVTFLALLAVTIKFQSATTDITAGFPIAINGGIALPYNPHGLFQTGANEALNINLSLATSVGVNVTWVQAT